MSDEHKPADPKSAEAKKAEADKARAAQPDPNVAALAEVLRKAGQAAGPAGATPDLDVAPPGGRFIVDGKAVNCNGRELNDDNTLKHPEEQKVDAYGRLI